MKKIRAWLKHFFLPPSTAPTWVRVLPYAILGVLTLIVITASAYGWEYTNSPSFCGTSCHTMPPEYTSYLTSPHARIACVDCHIGRGFIATRVSRKAGDLKHVFATLFSTYEYPIRAGELRPARETCELCHFPEKFSDDSLRSIKRYTNDRANTPQTIYLVLKTGGGTKRQGLGRGIHWHVLNDVYFLPTDEVEQEIPYIKTINEDGTTSEYIDIENPVDPKSIDPTQLKKMDCITCHNRITHLVYPPEDTVDNMITRNVISAEIPEIRLKAIEVYSHPYESVEIALNGIAGLENYYLSYYPDYYAANKDKIDVAVSALQTAYQNSVFPEQKSNWASHPNNKGHKDSPGCFRCHDGKHLDANNKAIRLECNLCHSIPVVSGPEDFVSDIEISNGPEPESHLNENWITMHHQAFNPTCSNCHTTENPGGTDNSSFCSNSACHGSVWKYSGFDAPALREVILSQLPPTPTAAPVQTGGELTWEGSIAALFQSRCGSCHGEAGIQNLNLTSYSGIMTGGKSGPAITPNDAQNSLLVQKQSGSSPHFGQLTPEELERVIEWINAGAPEK